MLPVRLRNTAAALQLLVTEESAQLTVRARVEVVTLLATHFAFGVVLANERIRLLDTAVGSSRCRRTGCLGCECLVLLQLGLELVLAVNLGLDERFELGDLVIVQRQRDGDKENRARADGAPPG